MFSELGASHLTSSLSDALREADHSDWGPISGNQVPTGPWNFSYFNIFSGEECEISVAVYDFRPAEIRIRPLDEVDGVAWGTRMAENLTTDYGAPAPFGHELWGDRIGWTVGTRYLAWSEGTAEAPEMHLVPAKPDARWFDLHPSIEIEQAVFTGNGSTITAKLTLKNTGSTAISGKLPIEIGTWETSEDAFMGWMPFNELLKVKEGSSLTVLSERVGIRTRFLTRPPAISKNQRVFSGPVKLAPGATTTITVTVPAGFKERGNVLATASVLKS